MSKPDWMQCTAKALPALLSDVALWSDINSQVEAFFAANPNEPRTPQSETVLRALIFNRLTNPQPNAHNG